MDRRPLTCRIGLHHPFQNSPPVVNPCFFKTYISIFQLSVATECTCSLLGNRSSSLRKQFPAISQSQFLIEDASLKKSRTFPATSYLISTLTTCRRSTYPLTTSQVFIPANFLDSWRSLKSQTRYLVSFVRLYSALYLAFNDWAKKDPWAEPEKCRVYGNQLGPDHGQYKN